MTHAHTWSYSNVLGGNFALVASPSVGASGAIFGTVAVSKIVMTIYFLYSLCSFLGSMD